MTIKEIADKLLGNIMSDNQINVSSFYCGDFLSRVMSKAPPSCGWLTVMNNINIAGVAVMADIPLIILCEGVSAGDALIDRLRQENIALILTELSVFECCCRLVK